VFTDDAGLYGDDSCVLAHRVRQSTQGHELVGMAPAEHMEERPPTDPDRQWPPKRGGQSSGRGRERAQLRFAIELKPAPSPRTSRVYAGQLDTWDRSPPGHGSETAEGHVPGQRRPACNLRARNHGTPARHEGSRCRRWDIRYIEHILTPSTCWVAHPLRRGETTTSRSGLHAHAAQTPLFF
jgi:hypothetical protein